MSRDKPKKVRNDRTKKVKHTKQIADSINRKRE